MTVQLNHTIVVVRDKVTSAAFYTEVLGLPPARMLGPFAVVQTGETSLDLVDGDGPIQPRHFAFLVSEEEFDAIFARIRERGLGYWADPFHRLAGQINTYDDGRGVYFDDPDGHHLEILTRPYGSGGYDAESPNPLLPPRR
ncbi:MAG: VOC family protein [Sandaracinaceae bacterium]